MKDYKYIPSESNSFRVSVVYTHHYNVYT